MAVRKSGLDHARRMIDVVASQRHPITGHACSLMLRHFRMVSWGWLLKLASDCQGL